MVLQKTWNIPGTSPALARPWKSTPLSVRAMRTGSIAAAQAFPECVTKKIQSKNMGQKTDYRMNLRLSARQKASHRAWTKPSSEGATSHGRGSELRALRWSRKQTQAPTGRIKEGPDQPLPSRHGHPKASPGVSTTRASHCLLAAPRKQPQ